MDPRTGEYDVSYDYWDEYVFPLEYFEAISKRIGNMSAVGHMREHMTPLLDQENSIILNKIVYNAIHDGEIPVSELDQLEAELNHVEEHYDRENSLVRYFIECFRELIAAARKENNPIVF
ncbi:hypothetical protein [Thalassoporum mexicanum]|uniref:hypothetical protein n=1 Tax=Thalassoporum mexicanum TaxID=3457544 RepID=UPI0012EA7A37|nr:hypothetical protein [Pseudanabaena sp. PCC 7367]